MRSSWALGAGLAVAAASIALGARGEVGGPEEGPADAEADGQGDAVPNEAAAPDEAGVDAAAVAEAARLVDGGARDAEPASTGFAFALHGGAAFPFGRAKNSALSDVVAYSIPVGVDIGYFITRHLFVGGYFNYGFASNAQTAQSTCPPEAACGAQQFRFGVNAAWRFLPRRVVDPWAGLSFGYDLINLTASDSVGNTISSAPLYGLEIGLHLGVDIRPASFWGFGPYVELSGGHYEWSGSYNLHGWVTPGVRVFTLLSGI